MSDRARQWRLWWVGLVGVLAAGLACASEGLSVNLSAEAGLSVESQSSPLVQLSPNGTLLYLKGLQRLHGSALSSAFQGFAAMDPAAGVSASVGLDVSVKRSPDNPDLDFFHYSLQSALHLPWAGAGASVGMGAGFDQIGLAGQVFRNSSSLQFDWTAADPQGHWALITELADRRHRAALADLDARAISLLVQRHQTRADSLHPLLESLDLALHLGREQNAAGFAELSSRSVSLQATLHGRLAGVDWSVGGAWNHVRFDASAFAGEPVRRDAGVGLDLAAEWPLGREPKGMGRTLRLAYNLSRNHSSTRLYDNLYQQLAAILRLNW